MSWNDLVEKHGSSDIPLTEDLPACPHCQQSEGYEKICYIAGAITTGIFEQLDAAEIKDNASITAYLKCLYCRADVGMIVGNIVIIETEVLAWERIRGKNVG